MRRLNAFEVTTFEVYLPLQDCRAAVEPSKICLTIDMGNDIFF
jgi:hypothetical protein